MKIKNILKKIMVTGAVILGTIAPAYANETEVQAPVLNETVIEMTVESQEETVIEEEVIAEEETVVEEEVVVEKTPIAQYRAELTKAEWNEFVAEHGWDNVQFVTTEGEYMVFEAFKCGVKVADVFFKEIVIVEEPEVEVPEVEEDVNYDDQITTLPDDVVVEEVEEDVNYDDQITTLPDDVVVEEVEEDVNYDDQITTLPDDVVVEEVEVPEVPEVQEPEVPEVPEVQEPVVPEVKEPEVTTNKVVTNIVTKKVVKKSGNGVIERDLILNPRTGDADMTINFVIIAISVITIFVINRKKSVSVNK